MADLSLWVAGSIEVRLISSEFSLLATALAAASIMSSFTALAPLAMQPKPTPADHS